MLSDALEQERLATLARLVPDQDVLSDLVEDLVIRASEVAGAPLATLNLLDADYQRQPVTEGFTGGLVPRSVAMCNAVLAARHAVYASDARLDPVLATSPWVDGTLSSVRFYASFPLLAPTGPIIGTLCVYDTEVHELDDGQLAELQQLADQVMERIVSSRN